MIKKIERNKQERTRGYYISYCFRQSSKWIDSFLLRGREHTLNKPLKRQTPQKGYYGIKLKEKSKYQK